MELQVNPCFNRQPNARPMSRKFQHLTHCRGINLILQHTLQSPLTETRYTSNKFRSLPSYFLPYEVVMHVNRLHIFQVTHIKIKALCLLHLIQTHLSNLSKDHGVITEEENQSWMQKSKLLLLPVVYCCCCFIIIFLLLLQTRVNMRSLTHCQDFHHLSQTCSSKNSLQVKQTHICSSQPLCFPQARQTKNVARKRFRFSVKKHQNRKKKKKKTTLQTCSVFGWAVVFGTIHVLI